MFGFNIRVQRVRWLATGLATVVLLVAIMATGLTAQSQTEDSTEDTIRACEHLRTGVIVINRTASCPDDWAPLEWSIRGPTGPPGPSGTAEFEARLSSLEASILEIRFGSGGDCHTEAFLNLRCVVDELEDIEADIAWLWSQDHHSH